MDQYAKDPDFRLDDVSVSAGLLTLCHYGSTVVWSLLDVWNSCHFLINSELLVVTSDSNEKQDSIIVEND